MKDVEYNPETGEISRRGTIRGSVRPDGYLHSSIDGKFYLNHRLACYLYYGEWPNGNIDHMNGDRQDNRISNLRVVNQSTNVANQKSRGVYKYKYGYRAVICRNRTQYNLGTFKTYEEARQAYLNKAIELDGYLQPRYEASE